MLLSDKIKVLNKPPLFQNFAASALSALSLFGSRRKKNVMLLLPQDFET